VGHEKSPRSVSIWPASVRGQGEDAAGGRSRKEPTMKQYLLSVYMVEGAPVPSESEMQQAFADVDALNRELQQAGVWVFGGGLHPADTATVVRVDGGDALTTDGPFAETKEQLGGFWIITAPDLDGALAWAAKAATACRNPVEVRPFQEEPEA
jgi:hypothetical protein